MGVVWRAHDTTLDRDVAIKFLPPAFARDAERLARFDREAKAVAALSHPGILAIFGFGEHDGSPYAVTELLEGQTLRDALAAGALAPARATEIARQVAHALATAHDRGIVHRDLKPENIFLTRTGHTKILDFGLASHVIVEAATGVGSDASPTHTSLTTPGTVLGTTDYLSPEQVRGLAADARSDIFSFGSILYEMLSGRRPFRRDTAAETMTAILRADPAALASTTPALAGIVGRCLAKNPADRFASARDLASAVDAAADDEPRVRPGYRLPLAIVTVAIVASMVGVGIWKGRAGSTSQEITWSLTSIGEAPSPHPEANEYLEKGLLFLRTQLDLPRAQSMLDRAIEIDPAFGSARAMRALTDVIAIHEGYVNDVGLVYAGEREMREVIVAQPDLASAHATLGAMLLYLNRKEQANEEFETALRVNPHSQPGAIWLTIDDHHSGRPAAAEGRLRQILEQIPLFWAARLMLAEVVFEDDRIDEARREVEKVFEQDPVNLGATRAMARILIYQGDTSSARNMLEGISAAGNPNLRVRLLWALLLAREGKADLAVAALDAESLKYARIALFAPVQVAEVFALAGHTEDALDWLDQAVRNGDGRSAWFGRDALLANIQAQPRFQPILDAVERDKP